MKYKSLRKSKKIQLTTELAKQGKLKTMQDYRLLQQELADNNPEVIESGNHYHLTGSDRSRLFNNYKKSQTNG